MSERTEAVTILETLTNDENGYTHKELLEHIIVNYLSGDQALEVMNACIEEFPSPDFEEGDDEEEEEKEFTCPVCGSNDVDSDYNYDSGRLTYICKDCEHEAFEEEFK
jgi:hypothetical protein